MTTNDRSKFTLMTAQAAAELINVSKRTWYRLNSAGKVPAPVRISGIVRWNPVELAHWIEAGTPDRTKWNYLKGKKHGK